MFTTDSRTERFLESFGVKWHYTNDMTLTGLSSDWYEKNAGRSQVRVDAAVREYGKLMDRGSAAPAPILWLNPNTSRHDILDGLQRLLTERDRNPATFSAYIADTDSEAMVQKLRVFANYRLQGGYQESSEWTLEKAIESLVSDGVMNIEEVAEMGGWTLTTVRDKKQIMDYGAAVRGVGGPEKLPDSILRVASKHATRADFAAAPTSLGGFFEDIGQARFSAAEAEPYIEEFFAIARNKGGLFAQFAAKLEEFRKDEEVATRLADPTRRRYQPMTAEGRLLKSLKATRTTAKRIRDTRESIPYMDEYFQVLEQIRTMLTKIQSNSRKR